MTKAEEFDKARRLAYKGDFSLVEKLYHPGCKSFDHRVGMEVNLDMQNALVPIYDCRFGPIENLDELASKLGQKAGIAEFGIFIGTASEIIVATSHGIRYRKRNDS